MSLDYADLIMCLDDEFGLHLHENEGVSTHLAHETKTVGQLHTRLVQELRRRGSADSNAVWHKVCAIVGKVLHKNPSTIRPEHRFVEDLGMN